MSNFRKAAVSGGFPGSDIVESFKFNHNSKENRKINGRALPNSLTIKTLELVAKNREGTYYMIEDR